MKRSKFWVLVLCLVVLTVVFITACGTTETPTADAQQEDAIPSEVTPEEAATEQPESGNDSGESDTSDASYTFGLTICSQNTFTTILANSVQARCDELGIELITLNGNDDIEKQVSDFESLITRKVDMILLHPGDTTALNSTIAASNAAGIPVICVNTKATSEDLLTYVGSNDKDAGMLQGEYLEKVTGGEAKLGIIHGMAGHSATIGRTEGLKVSFIDKYPDTVQVLDEQMGQWSRDEGMRIMEDWIQAYPDMNVVVAESDDMALGAVQAIIAANKKGNIIVCGIDAVDDAVKAVKEGNLDMTVFQDAEAQGAKAVDVAYDVLKNGASYEDDVLIPFVAVTKDNVDSFKK